MGAPPGQGKEVHLSGNSTLATPTALSPGEEQEGLRAGSRTKHTHTCSGAFGAEFQGLRESNYNNLLFAELAKFWVNVLSAKPLE